MQHPRRIASTLLLLMWALTSAGCSAEHLPETPVPDTPCETDAECVLVRDECTPCGQTFLHVDDADAYRDHATQAYCRAMPRSDVMCDPGGRLEAVCREDSCSARLWMSCWTGSAGDGSSFCNDEGLGGCNEDTNECVLPIE